MELIHRRVLDNPWIPITPTPQQAAFLALPCREALYGGAAGGGKSVALLAGAAMYVDEPGYHALLLRRTFADLEKADALIPMSQEWWSGRRIGGSAARYNSQEHRWYFPSGATVSFGYLEHEAQKYQYQGTQVVYIGWDELTQFTEAMYTYLFSRLRRRRLNMHIPLRVRAASNPGGWGHVWVKKRFGIQGFGQTEFGRATGRVFVPSKLDDNPHLDRETYLDSLMELDPVTRQQLRDGDWDIRMDDGVFDPEALDLMRRCLRTGRTGYLKPVEAA